MRGFVLSICLLWLSATGSASAQSYYEQRYALPDPAQNGYAQNGYAQQRYARQAPPQTPPMVVAAPPQETRGNYGGGFIEFVFGDRPSRQPPPQHYIAPPQGYGGSQQVQQYANASPQVDPMLERPGPAIDPQFEPQDVDYRGPEAPGTIVIDTPKHYLYLVQENGRAMRYGIGVGRPGFTWSGMHTVTAKKEWPDWVPPPEMLQRQPYLPHFMPGGPNNPLGARAMYLGSTLYRIHGSNEPWTIGQNVSSGCIRMRNVDVIDLYSRVKVGTKVVVL
jgi:lipoprotein-anchoring transpeptidase ErfK/SrfK